MHILLFKLSAALVLSVAALCLLHHRQRIENHAFLTLRNSALLFLSSRLTLYGLVFHAAGQTPRSDVTMFFSQATQAALGQVVYRDFESVYGPLFAYILAVFVKLWHDPRVLILAVILFEWAALKATVLCFGDGQHKRTAFSVLFYAVLPAPLICVVISGQEDMLPWFFAALAFYTLHRGRSFLSGAIVAAGFLATKLLFVLGAGPLILFALKPLLFALGLSLLGAVYLPLYAVIGGFIFQPFGEAANLTPPNIWFLLNAGGLGVSHEAAASIGTVALALLGLAGMAVGYRWRNTIRGSPHGYAAFWCLIFCAVMILSPKSLGTYVLFFQLPLVFTAIHRSDALALRVNVILGGIATFETSYWVRLGLPPLTERPLPPSQVAELLFQVCMLVCLILLTWRSLTWLRTTDPAPARTGAM